MHSAGGEVTGGGEGVMLWKWRADESFGYSNGSKRWKNDDGGRSRKNDTLVNNGNNGSSNDESDDVLVILVMR